MISQQDHPAWRKSTYSDVDGNGNCVEVAVAPGEVGVRDSKSPETGTLVFPATEWTQFVRTL